MDWVPAYLDLWVDDKADLSHATRSLFLRLCIAARRARRDGLVPLSPTATTDELAVHAIVQGRHSDTKAALSELLAYKMIAIEVTDDGRALRVLSWDRWALGSSTSGDESITTDEHARTPAAERARRWRQNRKRANGANATNVTPERQPNAFANGTERVRERSGEHDANVRGCLGGGGKGGAPPPDQKRSEDRKVEKKTAESAVARDDDDDEEPTGDATDAVTLRALRALPAIARYEQEGSIRLAKVAMDVAGECATYVVQGKLRSDEVSERVLAAVDDVDRKVRGAASTPNPWPAKAIGEKLLSFVRTNLGKSRDAWNNDRRGNRPSSPGRDDAPKRFAPAADPEAVPAPAHVRRNIQGYGNGGIQ